eukprot:PhM_4_TR16333/c0_g1_i1/m.69384
MVAANNTTAPLQDEANTTAVPAAADVPRPPCRLHDLLLAVEHGNRSAVAALVTEKNVNLCDTTYGMSLVAWAAQMRHVTVLSLLLDIGANVHVRDFEGFTAIHRAAFCGFEDVVVALVEQGGADPRDHSVPHGMTPMGLAAMKGHTRVLQALVDKGVGIDEVDGCGYTPLARATDAAHSPCVEWLVGRGASVNAVTGESDGACTVRGVCERRFARAQTRTELVELQRIIFLLGMPTSSQSATTLR